MALNCWACRAFSPIAGQKRKKLCMDNATYLSAEMAIEYDLASCANP